ncbi:MAG: TonB-dependent receptor [Limnothrix sp.]
MFLKSFSLAAILLVANSLVATAQEVTPDTELEEIELEETEFEEEFESYEFEFTIIDELLNQVIFAPFRQEGTVKESSRPAYVINRDQIEAQSYRTVNEALKYFPGIFTDSTAGTSLGALSGQIMRGANSSAQTLILLDGRAINTFDSGAFDLSSLSTDNVERIELIPGGSSTLFGSNAIGGVINIVTRRPGLNEGWTSTVGLGIGTLGYNKQQVAVSYGGENSTVRVAYDRTAAENDFDFELDDLGLSGTRENAQAEIQNINLQATGLLGDRHTLRFNGIYASKDTGIPGGVQFPSLNATAYNEDWLLSLDLESKLGEGDDSVLTTRIFADFNDAYSRNPDFGFDVTSENTSIGTQIQHNWQLTEKQNLTYGADYRYTTVLNQDLGVTRYDEDLSQGAIFARYGAAVTPELDLNVGLRQDFNSLADGSFTSPSAGFLWKASESTSIRGNYARNFRTPTATDLFFDVPAFFSAGNADLVPEIGNSFDIGIDQKIGDRALVRLTYFNNTLSDALNYVVNPNTFIGRVENIGKVRNQGLEVELTVQLSPTVYAFANYTMNNSKILENANSATIDNEIAFAGTDFFNVGLAYENQRGAYVGLFLKNVGDRFTNNTNTFALDSYTNVDLRARYPINENLNLTASWENIFDEDFITFANSFSAYPGVGSRFQIGFNAKFR